MAAFRLIQGLAGMKYCTKYSLCTSEVVHFCSLQSISSCSGAYAASYSVATEYSLHEGKAAEALNQQLTSRVST